MKLIDHSPIAKMRKPPALVRQDFIPPEKWPELLNACSPEQLGELVLFMLLSGCRVQEIRRLEARYHNPNLRQFVLPIIESKGKRSSRVVPYPKELASLIQRKIAEYLRRANLPHQHRPPLDQGRLELRNATGEAKAGVASLCGTMFRHSDAHAELSAGQDSHLVAKKLGHKTTRMLELRYGHVERNPEIMQATADFLTSKLPQMGLGDVLQAAGGGGSNGNGRQVRRPHRLSHKKLLQPLGPDITATANDDRLQLLACDQPVNRVARNACLVGDVFGSEELYPSFRSDLSSQSIPNHKGHPVQLRGTHPAHSPHQRPATASRGLRCPPAAGASGQCAPTCRPRRSFPCTGGGLV